MPLVAVALSTLLAFGLMTTLPVGATDEGPYDPMAVPAGFDPVPHDRVVKVEEPPREIPVRVYLPKGETPAPVLLFSHGLGGSREGSAYLGRHWSARGYVAVFLQHPGSDEAVWKDRPLRERRKALEDAASASNFLLRVKDVSLTLDQVARWNMEDGHVLHGRLDLANVGMSGHSFGAITTQAVSGQSAAGGLMSFRDPRIKAAVIMSPSCPRRGDAAQAFSTVDIPWLLMTGTHDLAVIGDADMDSRLGVFPVLPPGRKYELILDQGEHSAFTDRALPGDHLKRNPNHHRVILALSTAFWDAYLRHDEDARKWLDGDGPRSILDSADCWRTR